MPMETTSIKTERDALREIVSWSLGRPKWQRDALRRLVVSGELSSDDITELTALCKESAKQNEPLETKHFGAQTLGAPTVALRNIRDIQNVNALAEGQTLNFIPKGVTIVYGDNGAGKSGYVRILKQACRARIARGKGEEILDNIYVASSGPQVAEIEYDAGAQSQKSQWKNGEKPDDLLSEISVFDSRTANVHVEETNDLAYTPYPMKLLERLVNACKAVKENFDAEISTLKLQTPESIKSPKCSPDTKAGKLINKLGKNTDPQTVHDLSTLSVDEGRRLAELAADFAQDPKATARRLRAEKVRLENIRADIIALHDAISDENADEFARLAANLTTKEAAALLASQNLSKDEPLEGVGSEVWRSLWEAARAYSTDIAYPDKDYPATDDNARCVLCQQELDADAAARLRRFENFVQDRTQQDASRARQALSSHRETLRDANIPHRTLREALVFVGDELGNHTLSEAIRQYVIAVRLRHRAMLRANGNVPNPVPTSVTQSLSDAVAGLETRAAALLADDNSDERKAMRAKLAELQDRQWLSGIKDDVIAEIGRRKSIDAIETALKDTRPNTITAKNTTLSEALITERLRGTFAREIDHMNLSGLAIELTQAGSQAGVSRFRVSLMQSASSNAGDILSEGEYRCVALAGFMAELATNNSGSGIIFDDPVSSLDHLHREAIAKRLAEEGRKRQVVVFTHDLPFLFLLRNACAQVDDPSLKTDIALRHIQKRQNSPGHCRNEAPDKAQDAKTRLAQIRKHLANTRILYDRDPDSTDWLINARGLIDSLRQTWETAVEDAISPVLRTFGSKVNTKGFAKLSAITEADANTMRQHYGQCSELLHKASDALYPKAPTPDVIEIELNAMGKWLVAVSDRQAKIKTS